jgi:Ca2+-binding RTX toxin-like protein
MQRWTDATHSIPYLNSLDLPYTPLGAIGVPGDQINSNSAYRIFGEIMGLPVKDFPWRWEPGMDMGLEKILRMKDVPPPPTSLIEKLLEQLFPSANASELDPSQSDALHDLVSRFQDGQCDLDAVISGCRKLLDNQGIEDAKTNLDHAKSTSSPIILDLDGNGVATTAVQAGAYFDHAGDGFAERSGWAGAGDGLLARDLGGNGLIDTGAELFGSETRLPDGTKAANGFEALAALDGNSDGQIDAGDAAFAALKVWIDANGDGYSQPEELLTLTEAGVEAIAAAYLNADIIDANGNAHRQIGAYTRADGSQAAAEDVWFAVDRTYSLATAWADVPAEIAALPDLPGYGMVRDLRQAMALNADGGLKALVVAYMAEPDEGRRHSLLDSIVYAWAGADGIDPASRGSYVDARQLAALEKLLGDGFYQSGWGANPGATAGKQIGAAYANLADSLAAQLDAQTRYADLYAHLLWVWDGAAQATRPDFSNAIPILQAQLSADPAAGLALLDGFARNLKMLDQIDAAGWQSLVDGLAPAYPDAAEVLRRAQLDTLTGGAAADKLDGGSGDECLLGFGGDDILNGQGGNDVLEGGDGQDTLEGGAGNDLVKGGAGDDWLDGNSGSDVYLFQAGFGQDHIHQYDSALDSLDTARFSGLPSQAVARVTRQGGDLALDLLSGDRLTVDGYFDSAPRRVDVFEFADGGRWDVQAVKERADTLGTAAADVLYGYTGTGNRIYGLDGNDELHGNSGNDALSGGPGDDLLYGQSGDDILDGGAGGDTLKGGAGNDSYVVDSSGDAVVESSGSGIDSVLTSVSYTLPANVENLTLAVDADSINGTGNTLNNVLTGNGGNNALNGGAGVDVLAGGGGADSLTGGAGADTFKLSTATGGADLITDFLSGTDLIRLDDLASGLGLGNRDGVIDNATTVSGPGGFTPSNELVIVTGNIIGPITAASAAGNIGSATSAYTEGYAGVFVVDNGTDSALFRFVSSAADAAVGDTELTLIGTLQGTASTTVLDYAFGA